MTRQKFRLSHRKGNILIVCGAGVGTSLFLQHQITEIVGNNYAFEIKDFRNSQASNLSCYDLIVSTVELSIKSEKIMKVDAMLTAAQKSKIFNWFHTDEEKSEHTYIEDIMSLVENNAVITNRMKMIIELRKCLESYDDIHKIIRLKDVLTADMITFFSKPVGSTEAIRIACAPLVAANLVEGEYADSILKLIEEKGLYFEIVPGILLAHAQPSATVHGVGLSLTV